MSRSSKPHLTYLITGLQYGGANIGMARLLSGLNPDKFEVTVVAVVDTDQDVVSELPEHVEVRHLRASKISEIYRLKPLMKILAETDLLVCSLFHATAVGIPLGRLARVPRILVWQHSTSYASKIRSSYYRFAYQVADHVLADSEAVRSLLVEERGVRETKISTLPIAGVDMDKYHRQDIESFNDSISISSIGRIGHEKGFDYLIECAEKLSDRFRFYIAGDGPERLRLEREAPDNVVFHGKISNSRIPNFLNRSDIYFQPSRYEGLCMTVIEAMACGLPVVASSVGGITESVQPEKSGYLCNPGEVNCYVQCLERLGRNPELRKEMGTAGRERVMSRYSREELVNRFQEVVAKTL